MHRSAIGISILLAAGVNPSKGQGSATALNIEIQNLVEYQVDTFDFSKAGTNPNVTIGTFSNLGCSQTVEVLRKCASAGWVRFVRRSSMQPNELALEVTDQRAGGARHKRRLVLTKQSGTGPTEKN